MPVTAASARGRRKLPTLTEPRPSRGRVGEDGRVSLSAGSGVVAPVGYAELLEQVKVRVRTSRVQAARAVNTELVSLYWQIGRLILNRQESEGWGSKVIGRLAADLRAEFPGMRGLSQRSLVYMRTFAGAFEAPIAQQAAAQLPWGTSWCCWTR